MIASVGREKAGGVPEEDNGEGGVAMRLEEQGAGVSGCRQACEWRG